MFIRVALFISIIIQITFELIGLIDNHKCWWNDSELCVRI